MLSRVADSLYWMSRYLERAEHTARLLDVTLHQMLEQSAGSVGWRLARLAASLQVPIPPESSDVYGFASAVTFDPATPSSILASIAAARENARQVREQISSEMWEQLNRLYLDVRRPDAVDMWRAEPQRFYKAVKEGAHLFQGITDATMSHDEGWQFMQIGRYTERMSATATLLDAHFQHHRMGSQSEASLTYLDWVVLLKSCTAFEAYCKVYTADIQPERIAEFLLLNAEFPRSIRFASEAIQTALQVIARQTGSRSSGRVDRLAGRLRASLDYGQVDELLVDFHGALDQIRKQCVQIHGAIYHAYVNYPADAALV